MKKFLPVILLVLGVVVLALVYFLVIKPSKTNTGEEEQATSLIEVSLDDRPVTSLTPTSDGHWLNLKVEKINIPASTMDYELLYDLPDGRTQGVPGAITLNGLKVIERKLLLGSESSGKYRYDEGVKEGTLTLRFRNSGGKLIAKFTTKFALLSNTKELASVDGAFTATLDKTPKAFFVVMETFGIPASSPSEVKAGPFGLFSSQVGTLTGKATLGSYSVLRYTGGAWKADSFDTGVFIGVAQ
jgi:hypothetical protein